MTKLLCCSSSNQRSQKRRASGGAGGGRAGESSSCSSSGSDSEDRPSSTRRGKRRRRRRRRARATYRYEVVYRREECFSADYLDHFRPDGLTTDTTDSQQLRPSIQQQQLPLPPPPTADYSLLSNYGRLEDVAPSAGTVIGTSNWRTEESYEDNDQPLYQNYSGILRKSPLLKLSFRRSPSVS